MDGYFPFIPPIYPSHNATLSFENLLRLSGLPQMTVSPPPSVHEVDWFCPLDGSSIELQGNKHTEQNTFHGLGKRGDEEEEGSGNCKMGGKGRRRIVLRVKWAAYIATFSVFKVMVILVFALVVMKVWMPKFRIGDIQIQTLTPGNSTTPAFDVTFNAPSRIKNTNFGTYKYEASSVIFMCGGGWQWCRRKSPIASLIFEAPRSRTLPSTSGWDRRAERGESDTGKQWPVEREGGDDAHLQEEEVHSDELHPVTINVAARLVQHIKCA